MSKTMLRSIGNLIALIATIAVNALATMLPLNGLDTGAISDGFPVKFVPAGYVFSIWSIIYLGLTAFVIYQFTAKGRESELINRIGAWFIISCVFNCAWLFAWHYEQFALCIVLMLALLGSLIMIYKAINTGYGEPTKAERWLVKTPFSIYLGWISVATIANATITLYDLGWRGAPLTDSVWAAILLVIGTGLAAFFLMRFRDVAYASVIAWAYVGIVVKQSETPLVAITAGIMAAIVIGMIFLTFINRTPRLKPALR